MSDSSLATESKPVILDILPDFPISGPGCAMRIQQQIDLWLLAIEALELGASEYMLQTIQQLNLQEIVKNRIVLWRLRSTNPWRRSYARDTLNLEQAKALVIIASYRAKTLTVQIRQLLLAEQQMREKGLPVNCHFLLAEYLDQFRSHFSSRMNPRRAKVSIYLASEAELNELALSLLKQLLFCTGTTGMQRFWISLFDGEVA
ncbi:hypothetical protein AsFPU1_3289 [Aphanothece sacrum FPU1]|uniref:DUF3038 domain-containing protein n=1 Tax=Aphanothece sacrum FPU1 TaxID=1920663 RepID=A0A401IKU5_APHSA|nr:DUF3038 domain-containing protein [Aphanothece sacrum]GBF81867.1 hypothetical protein AsFPU1_3289 [Aphanothece sacrum FPU1]GBF85686.1 hypothetical protein AsFPU3_2751 [Aphanothece sacrum FPU3]